jgi:two-component system chemotaxis response regulator CheB
MEVVEPALLIPGYVYIARGDADIILTRNPDGLMAMPAPPQPGYPWHPSADRLVRSAMNVLEAEHMVGVLMTGMGNDGAKAMAELRMRGGRTIAESQETAVIWGMPGELVKAGGADFVLPLNEISAQLQKLVA